VELDETVSQVTRSYESLELPKGLSFFDPHLQHYVSEMIRIGGEAYVSKSPNGDVSGLFIYDDAEKSGTIFTRSRKVFDQFFELRPFDSVFAEMKTEHKGETYNILSIDLEATRIDHKFRNEISIEDSEQIDEIRQFMALTHPGTNKNWVTVALDDGDQCFSVRLQDEIAGLGWATNINRVGRLHSLFVKPQFRRLGIGQDIAFARLLWLKSKGVQSAFSEISQENLASSRIALKTKMKVAGQIFQYEKTDFVKPSDPGIAAD